MILLFHPAFGKTLIGFRLQLKLNVIQHLCGRYREKGRTKILFTLRCIRTKKFYLQKRRATIYITIIWNHLSILYPQLTHKWNQFHQNKHAHLKKKFWIYGQKKIKNENKQYLKKYSLPNLKQTLRRKYWQNNKLKNRKSKKK